MPLINVRTGQTYIKFSNASLRLPLPKRHGSSGKEEERVPGSDKAIEERQPHY